MARLSSVRIPRSKFTSDKASVVMPAPKQVEIALAYNFGGVCIPEVKVGDVVKVGQLIAKGEHPLSVPIYASVSGTVKEVKPGSLVIESDGLQTVADTVKPFVVNSKEDLINAAKQAGLVGLGGAGFPTHVKLNADGIEYLVVNGAECEPFITSDHRTIVENLTDFIDGIQLVLKYINIPKAVIGVENEDDVKLLENAVKDYEQIDVHALPQSYPQGAEKVLIYETTGRIVEEGKLPKDVGVIVMNVNSIVKLSQFVKTGMPLVTKTITADGNALVESKNIVAPIGTKLADIAEFCGGYKTEPVEIIMGGPMMGVDCVSDQASLLAMNNAILFFDEKQARNHAETACIRCGKCLKTCPFNLQPAAMDRAYHANDVDTLKKLKVNLCMECGSCAFVCPANRHLVAYNKEGKKLLRKAVTK